ncbi:MAG TPA: hypothetical protein VMY40_15660 [Anaerolineae bacterium]|nr:hypothetical protein [Anaerolineae bacterium]
MTKRNRRTEANEVFAQLKRPAVLGDDQPRDPGGAAAAEFLMPAAYGRELSEREAAGCFRLYSRALLYVRSYTDGRPAVCDLVGDNGEGVPPNSGQVPANRVLRRDIPCGAGLGYTVAGVLRRWALPPQVVLVIVRQAEIEGPRLTRQIEVGCPVSSRGRM